ncbi:glycosyltransferase family 2 protein [Ornithobacterium rhinotracheale]
MHTPLVSVIIPIYNAAPHLKEAIESITNQTYKNLEIILVDDCSTDNSFEIAASIKDERIKLYKNQENLKISKTLNFAISKTKGEYIARMDADDISDLTRIEKQISFLENHQDIDFCGTAIRFFGEIEQDLFYKENIKDIRDEILQGSPFAHAATIFRTNIKPYLQYEDKYAGAEDIELFSRLLKKGIKGGNLNEILYLYRITGNQTIFLKENGRIKFNEKQKKISFNIKRQNLKYSYPSDFNFKNKELLESILIGETTIKNTNQVVEFANFINYLNTHSKRDFFSKNAFNKIFYYRVLSYISSNKYKINYFKLITSRNTLFNLFNYKFNS